MQNGLIIIRNIFGKCYGKHNAYTEFKAEKENSILSALFLFSFLFLIFLFFTVYSNISSIFQGFIHLTKRNLSQFSDCPSITISQNDKKVFNYGASTKTKAITKNLFLPSPFLSEQRCMVLGCGKSPCQT